MIVTWLLAAALAQDPPPDPAPADPSAAATESKLDIRLLSDTTMTYRPAEPVHLELFGVDVFARAKLPGGLTGLGEVIFGGHTSGVHVARMMVDVPATRNLKFRVGQFDAPIGDYVPTTPHGSSLYRLAVERPRLLSLEEGEEVLALHLIGAQALARVKAFGQTELRFNLAYGEDAIHFGAAHAVKPTAVRVGLSPTRGALAGSVAGVSYYFDRVHVEDYQAIHAHILATTSTTSAPDDEEQETFRWRQVAVAYLTYDTHPLSLRVEGYGAAHGADAFGTDAILYGGLLLGGYTVGLTTPYARFHSFTRTGPDPVFRLATPRAWADVAVGVRFALHQNVVIKIQGSHELESSTSLAALQVAFGI